MSPNPLPEMTPGERAAALVNARAIRAARAELLGRLRTNEITLADLFAMIDDRAEGQNGLAGRCQIRQTLRRVPGIGIARADRILSGLNIPADRRLVSLSRRQRRDILAEVAELQSRPSGAR